MSTLFKTFDNDLTARRIHDVRREPVGSFAGILGPDATVGSFDDVPHLRGQGTGRSRAMPIASARGPSATSTSGHTPRHPMSSSAGGRSKSASERPS
jgi:hypothetical protein